MVTNVKGIVVTCLTDGGGGFKNMDAVGILIPDKSRVQMVKKCPVVKWLGFHIATFS